jgi:hypothetical protein
MRSNWPERAPLNVADVLNRLDRPRQTGPGRWMTGCPICQSRQGRPVSVRELEDGRVLLHGFCGHSGIDIVQALGLQLQDLFPDGPRGSFPPARNRIPARDVLEAVAVELDCAAILLAEVVERRAINEEGWQRLALAAARVGAAAAHVR